MSGGLKPGQAVGLTFRQPCDFASLLRFLRERALPGVETVDATSYARVSGTPQAPAWVRITCVAGGTRLRLETHGAIGRDAAVTRVRQLFDLDADPAAITAALGTDPLLAPLLARHPGLRVPGAWDGFEIAVRAVLGQQVSVAAARTLATRLIQRHGTRLAQAPYTGLDYLFPTPAVLAEADLDGLGMTGARVATIRGIARALLEGRASLARGQALPDFVARWTTLPGIGDWTAHYMAMRILGHRDAFPAADIVLRRAAAAPGAMLSAKALAARAEAWRPLRSYAVLQLWRSTWHEEE